MTEAQIQDLARYRESDAFSALEKAVLDYAVGAVADARQRERRARRAPAR